MKNLFAQKKDILNIYFTAGYPKLDSTAEIILKLQSAGVDLIEIGMPYSDPMADGPTIQESGAQALQNGMTLDILFDQLSGIKNQVSVPLIWMGYLNQVMQYGFEKFCADCKAVGISGLIIPDLPMEVYESEYADMLQKYDLGISFLIAPQTSEDRIRKADKLSKGFVYMVSSAAITGTKAGIEDGQVEYFKRIQGYGLSTPRMIGFGISDHLSYKTACQYSNGAIIGSAFIKALKNGQKIEGFVREIRHGI